MKKAIILMAFAMFCLGLLAQTAPANLFATAISSDQINLSWTYGTTVIDGFRIYRRTGTDGNFFLIASVVSGARSYNNYGLSQNTTYYYRVTAYIGIVLESEPSNTASATTFPAVPEAPSNLTATAGSAVHINLSWTDNCDFETGFKVERKTGAGGMWAQIAILPANTTSYTNTGLAQNTTYYYRVRAYNVTLNSSYSNEASSTTFYSTPAAPSELGAAANSGTGIQLWWTDNSNNETGFKIERKTGAGGTWSQIATTGANSTTYINTGLNTNTTYYYRVRAYNVTVNSGYSNEAYATTHPAAPTDPNATAVSSSQINLSWSYTHSNVDGFKIYRKTGVDGTYALISTLGSIPLSYSNTGLSANTTYFYFIRAYIGTVNSGPSEEVSATTFPTAPEAPSNLTAEAESSYWINLYWHDHSYDEEGFKIERKTGADGTWAQIATVGPNVTIYWDISAVQNTTYYFRVRAFNGAAYSPYSNVAYATTPYETPLWPDLLYAVAVSAGQIDLYWQDNSTVEEGFKVERKTGSGGTWSQVATVGENVTIYHDTGLAENTTYYYRVRAYNGTANSFYSDEAFATTWPLATLVAPTNLVVTVVSSSQINLSWQDNCNVEQGFKIERKTGADGSWSQIATVGENLTNYDNTGLDPNTVYHYRVRTYNGNINSSYTNEAFGHTPHAVPATPLNLSAITSGGNVIIAWDAVPGASSYCVYRSSDHQTANWGAPVAQVTGTIYTGPATADKYFYKVTAVAGSEGNMVFVPGGTFIMGDTIDDGVGYSGELPTHSVALNSFYIGKYEVTQAEYAAIMGSNPASGYGVGGSYPVYYVKWYSALKYCNLRSMAEGLTPCYTIGGSTDPADWGAVPSYFNDSWDAVICNWSANGYRLPTEAEWEYAARSATNAPDYLYSGSDDINAVAWYSGNNSSGGSNPVGTKDPNGIGTHDMSGNLYEWCWDWSGSYSAEVQTNPTGPASGSFRVRRGGGWGSNAVNCRIASRSYTYPYSGDNILGFRVCRTRP